MKSKIVIFSIGSLILINGLFILLSALVSIYYRESVYLQLLEASLLNIVTGFLACLFTKNYDKSGIRAKEGLLIVSLGWVFVTVSGATPYIVTKTIPYFASAFFESVSGYTTTGATILNEIESLPKGILFWRSLTHWIGGMGIVVLAITIMPLLGIGGMQLFSAESPGIKSDKIHPRIGDTAKVLWLIYTGFTLVQIIMLNFAGMSLFDAVNHSFSSISTGGFSTKNISIAYWNNNPTIEYILMLFMFIGGGNFALFYFLFTGKLRKFWQDEEFKTYTLFVCIVSLFVACAIYFQAPLPVTDYQPQVYGRAEASIRHAFFQVISIVTTTGFITSDYSSWTPFLSIVFFGLLFTGGSSGSTSGGIKIVRHILLIKNSYREFKMQLHPNAIIPIRLNQKPVSKSIMHSVTSFFVLYMLIFFAGALVLGILGNDIITSLSASATTLCNAGPGLGDVNPVKSYTSLNDASKYCCSFLMLVGRLELFTLIIIFTPYFWKKI